MEKPFDPVEARVLACLVEKSITTPEYYPLTLNALTAACNQKSNRDPMMQVTDTEVVRALDSLRDRKLAWSVTLAGSRAPRYRHSLQDVIPLSPAHTAVLCELLLRGPQTLGELRTHASRMVEIPDTAAVQGILQDLSSRSDGPLVVVLPRQPGRREDRYAHLLCGAPPVEPEASSPVEPARLAVLAENERLAALEAKVALLQDELARLNARFGDFERQFQ
jgi:uncharacterized protein YceH (UPF0502 family)